MRLGDPEGGSLLEWYDKHGRDLPWRQTREPYPVWVSEVMLQQTQVATALPFYVRWMRELPNLEALASCDEERLLALWQGLGYYRRARSLQTGAKFILQNGWPTSAEDWLNVPGVGPYTSAAIASICFGEASAVVDGNVERVYARVCADSASGTALLKSARIWAQMQMYAKRPGDWNQAMMELGATICTPRNPKCDQCPIASHCSAKQSWRVSEFPVRRAKPRMIELHFRIEVPFDGIRFGVQQVSRARWWHGMWEFPTFPIEQSRPSPNPPSSRRLDKGGANLTPSFEKGSGHDSDPCENQWLEYLGEIKHTVTNHRLVYSVDLRRVEQLDDGLRKATLGEIEEIPLPSPQRKALGMAIQRLGFMSDS